MEKPANPGKIGRSILKRGFRKVGSVFSSKQKSGNAVDPSIGHSHHTAAITSRPEDDVPASPPTVIHCIPDITEPTNAVGSAPSATHLQSTLSEISATPSTLPADKAGPAVTAISSGAAVPNFDTSPDSDKPIHNADRTIITPQIAVAETANDSVTAHRPGVDPASINGRTAQP